MGGLLAVLLEEQLESGVGHFVHISISFLKQVRRQAGLQLRRLLTSQQVWHQLGNLRAEVAFASHFIYTCFESYEEMASDSHFYMFQKLKGWTVAGETGSGGGVGQRELETERCCPEHQTGGSVEHHQCDVFDGNLNESTRWQALNPGQELSQF